MGRVFPNVFEFTAFFRLLLFLFFKYCKHKNNALINISLTLVNMGSTNSTFLLVLISWGTYLTAMVTQFDLFEKAFL